MRIKYLLSGLILCLLGFLLTWYHSLGQYFDKFIFSKSKLKGHIPDWLVVIGIGMIVVGILILLLSFTKKKLHGNSAERSHQDDAPNIGQNSSIQFTEDIRQ
jgi:hypothetical protein